MICGERGGAVFPAPLLAKTGFIWAVVSLLLLIVHAAAIFQTRFPDPDDTLRLIQVRDWLAGQSWFDVAQYRIDAPGGGVPMHWSRLVDLPLAAVIFLLTPIMGSASAESIALVIVPLATLFCAMMLAARIAYVMLGREEATMAALLLVISVPIIFQFGPMRIDHHGWQLVCALAAINGLMARSPKRGGFVIGASLAIWLAISIEGLPVAAAFHGVLALRWLLDRGQSQWLVSALQGLSIVSLAVFLATRGLADLAIACDAISPVQLAMFTWGAVVLGILSRLEPMPKGALLAGFALAAGGALAMIGFTAPQCVTGGGFADLDPLVAQYWHSRVLEGMPIWEQTLAGGLQYLVMPLLGIVAGWQLAQRSDGEGRAFWRDVTLILIAAFAVSLLVARAGAAACIIAAPAMAWQVRSWLLSIRTSRKPAKRSAAMAALVLALMPTIPITVANIVAPMAAQARMPKGALPAPVIDASLQGSPSQVTAMTHLALSQCRIDRSLDSLNALEPGEIYAPLDIAPKLLFHSRHSVIATGHHRGNDAMRFVIATALGSAKAAGEALAERGVQYVALCNDVIEPNLYATAAPDGFAARLLSGKALDWLEPIETAPGTSFQLYRVKPTAAASEPG